tara:strand:+ start:335 stop:1321 length:987 start_codon:yes stop_codon:yes gene_type:complete
MIITKTPFRISFVGGGTDLKSFYSINGGQVCNTSIDKYLYVLVRKQIGFVEYKYRINWSKIEFKNHIKDIEHPIVRETLKFFKINFPIEIGTYADIPSNTGLGSSSAFAVGLVHAISKLLNLNYSKHKIAELASFIEIEKLKRPIGKQDHYASCFGGINIFSFNEDGKVKINKILLSKKNKLELEKGLLLLFTNIKRDATSTLKSQNKINKKRLSYLNEIKSLVNEFSMELNKDKISIKNIGYYLNLNWINKKKLSKKISTPLIEKKYQESLKIGVKGGKILGAGNGGFLLLATTIGKKKVIDHFKLKEVKFKISNEGTKIVYESEEV